MLLDDESRKKKEERLPLTVRLPKSLRDYLDKRAGERRGEVTRVMENALELHRYFYERLATEKPRLQQFALDEKIDWSAQEPEVFVRLVVRGLKDAERSKK